MQNHDIMVKRSITPLFIFSLPRSGSTLLQRILGTHGEICTISEPWILIPLLYTTRDKGVFAEYGHRATVEAIGDFTRKLPNGESDYSAAIREFATVLYSGAAEQKPGSRFFLDKTPRYHLIADRIIEIFPDAKFIFLWRNPLAVTASVIDTFGRGKWQLYDFKVDLFDGLENLVRTYDKHREHVCSVSFEELILDSGSSLERVFRYLDLPYNPVTISQFTGVTLTGGMGDRSGREQYRELSDEPLNKWKLTLSNPVRKMWSRKYLHWIGSNRLDLMGYDQQELLCQLSDTASSLKYIPSDVVKICYGIANCALEVRMTRKKFRQAPSWHYIHGHT